MSKAAKRERQRQNREAARAAAVRAEKRSRTIRAVRNALIAGVIVAGIILILNVTRGDDGEKPRDRTSTTSTTAGKSTKDPARTFDSPPPMKIDPAKTYTATLETSEGTIVIALDAKKAPVAVNNFVFLAREGFYDGLTFHRSAKDFVIQGGDPAGDGSGGPGYTVKGEVPTDHYPEGSLAAAKSAADPPGTFGSQFFVVTGPGGTTLPNDYARFGTVTKGLEVARRIGSYAPDTGDGPPTEKVTISKVTISESAPR